MATGEILLCTLNARYIHASFGLRYLKANLEEYKDRCQIVEFIIKQKPLDIVEAIVKINPKILGFGVYIWNVEQTTTVLRIVKKLLPETVIVIGGPEVSYEYEKQEIFRLANHLITGEGEVSFLDLCRSILTGNPLQRKVLFGRSPDVGTMKIPYELYSDDDIANRVVYVEASRGCPFRCQFCLSSLDKKVRNFPLETFLQQMDELHKRGVRHFKFVDRTFNLSVKTSKAILQFFLDRMTPDLFVHFEMVPDRFPQALRSIVKLFPKNQMQFEVGIQTFNPQVSARIDRRQNVEKACENLQFLIEETGVHVHTDLIVGLPGEDIDSFAQGFDRLIGLRVQEIQVGILKRLRGTPISRHTDTFQMVYSPNPPYEILQNADWSFEELSEMRKFARYWDLIANSGRFVRTLPILLSGQSPFWAFYAFSKWLYGEANRVHSISPVRLAEYIFVYLTKVNNLSPKYVGEELYLDSCRASGKTAVPHFLRKVVVPLNLQLNRSNTNLPSRQSRHGFTISQTS